jgi:hypothetical protein
MVRGKGLLLYILGNVNVKKEKETLSGSSL